MTVSVIENFHKIFQQLIISGSSDNVIYAAGFISVIALTLLFGRIIKSFL